MVGHPITGVGIGAFPVAEGTISRLAKVQDYGEGLKWSAAHNSFVQVGAELGFPGLLVFLALLFAGLGRARRAVMLGLAVGDERAAAMGDALAASLVGYMVSGFFLSEGYSVFAYSMIGIAIGLHEALVRQASVRRAGRANLGAGSGGRRSGDRVAGVEHRCVTAPSGASLGGALGRFLSQRSLWNRLALARWCDLGALLLETARRLPFR